MCFSATASFGMAGVMAGIGAISVSANTSPRHRMLAFVPLLFAAQQATEGVVWLTIGRPDMALVLTVAVNAFLGFALVLWPTWLPRSMLMIEENARRRRLIQAVQWIGVAVSACGLSVLLIWPPRADIAGHSIRYDYPEVGPRVLQAAYFLLYLVPAVVPMFLSTMKMARRIGGVLLVSLIATILIKVDALTSVWCFFATVISILILTSIYRRQKTAAVIAGPAAQT